MKSGIHHRNLPFSSWLELLQKTSYCGDYTAITFCIQGVEVFKCLGHLVSFIGKTGQSVQVTRCLCFLYVLCIIYFRIAMS